MKKRVSKLGMSRVGGLIIYKFDQSKAGKLAWFLFQKATPKDRKKLFPPLHDNPSRICLMPGVDYDIVPLSRREAIARRVEMNRPARARVGRENLKTRR